MNSEVAPQISFTQETNGVVDDEHGSLADVIDIHANRLQPQTPEQALKREMIINARIRNPHTRRLLLPELPN